MFLKEGQAKKNRKQGTQKGKAKSVSATLIKQKTQMGKAKSMCATLIMRNALWVYKQLHPTAELTLALHICH